MMDAERLRRAIVVGHSLGAQAALHFASAPNSAKRAAASSGFFCVSSDAPRFWSTSQRKSPAGKRVR